MRYRMKALLYSIIILLFTLSLSSQTILKPHLSSSYGGHTINFDDTTVWAPRVQKHFMLGWQWAGFENRKQTSGFIVIFIKASMAKQ